MNLYKDVTCNHCGVQGKVYPDPLSSTYRCRACGVRVDIAFRVPRYDEQDDTVYDYYYDDNNEKQRIEYVVTKAPYDDSLFDPNTPFAVWGRKIYGKKFQRRRRYVKEKSKNN